MKGYCLWCLDSGSKNCIITRDIVFNETKMAYKPKVSKCMLVDNSDAGKVDIEEEFNR